MRILFIWIFFAISTLSHGQECKDSIPSHLIGIDISHYQNDISWDEMDTTISFIICKATEGTNLIDSKFESNWSKIPCVRGTYHFFRPNVSGKKQAELYLSVIDLKPGDIRPIIDVEWTRSWSYRKMTRSYIKNLLEMIQVITDNTGQVPIIYTSAYFWNKYIAPHYKNDGLHLWISDFRDVESPKIPTHFEDWHIWQHTNMGHVSGIIGRVDKNICKDITPLLIR